MNNQPIKISDNCWKHTSFGTVYYKSTSDPKSKLHREDGPAIEWSNGDKEWYINGKLHREDGPAIEWVIGTKLWYYHGTNIDVNSQKDFEIYLKNVIFI